LKTTPTCGQANTVNQRRGPIGGASCASRTVGTAYLGGGKRDLWQDPASRATRRAGGEGTTKPAPARGRAPRITTTYWSATRSTPMRLGTTKAEAGGRGDLWTGCALEGRAGRRVAVGSRPRASLPPHQPLQALRDVSGLCNQPILACLEVAPWRRVG